MLKRVELSKFLKSIDIKEEDVKEFRQLTSRDVTIKFKNGENIHKQLDKSVLVIRPR